MAAQRIFSWTSPSRWLAWPGSAKRSRFSAGAEQSSKESPMVLGRTAKIAGLAVTLSVVAISGAGCNKVLNAVRKSQKHAAIA